MQINFRELGYMIDIPVYTANFTPPTAAGTL
jgi:hypothetical protein